VFKADRRLYHSSPGLRVTNDKAEEGTLLVDPCADQTPQPQTLTERPIGYGSETISPRDQFDGSLIRLGDGSNSIELVSL
jgi:hypothetical protein